jgi:CheY-like chemotaxis protein
MRDLRVAAMSIPRVLVADDNPLSLRFFCNALAVLGIDCVEASDGAIALEQAGHAAFDLLLLDVRMPVLGGAEVLAGVRARHGPSQHTTALATTADNDAATHGALRAAGFADVLVKPLGVDALQAALDSYLPTRHQRGPASHRNGWLDENQALAAAGGDPAIVAALRSLLACELELLPSELAIIGERRDAHALRERLHRLDASAGFCGVPALLRAGSALRIALDAPAWPEETIAQFLETCTHARATLCNRTSAAIVGECAP